MLFVQNAAAFSGVGYPLESECAQSSAAAWPVYVISLDPRSPRGRQAETQLQHLGLDFEWAQAVNGSRLSARQIAEVFDEAKNRRVFKYPLSAPEIGCYLSHLMLWRRIADGSAEGAFIFEDDFHLSDDAASLLHSIQGACRAGDLVSLHAPRRRMFKRLGALTSKYRLVEPFITPARTTGYGLTKQAAASLVRTAVPFTRPVDIDLKHWWEFGIRSLAVDPSPLLPQQVAESSIADARRRSRSSSNQLVRLLRNLRYQVRYHSSLLQTRLQRWAKF